ncbi:MAG: hypothetical protein AAF616_02195 [Bacteroidota bacterium]
MEKLFLKSVEEKWAVEITLKSNKVYVGRVLKIARPHEKNHIRLLPLMSGYRNTSDMTLHFTTYYSKIYRHFEGKEASALNMDLIIERSNVISANRFDFEIYRLFGNQSETPQETQKKKPK